MNADEKIIAGVDSTAELRGLAQTVQMIWEQAERRETRDETRRVADETRFASLTASVDQLPDEMRMAIRDCRDHRCIEVAAEIAPVAADVKVLMRDRENSEAVGTWWHKRWRLMSGVGMAVVGAATVIYYWVAALSHAVH